MTRKDYIRIAAGFRKSMETCERLRRDADAKNLLNARAIWVGHMAGIMDGAASVADELASDNARFDRAKFLEACGSTYLDVLTGDAK